MSRVLPLRMRIKMVRRQRQRIDVVRKILSQYFEPCPWCKKYRPGQEPNMTPVKIPNSHGMCKECFDKAMEEIKTLREKREKKAE